VLGDFTIKAGLGRNVLRSKAEPLFDESSSSFLSRSWIGALAKGQVDTLSESLIGRVGNY